MTKIIITGATGFIGKKLVEHFLSKDYEIVVFSRNTERSRNIFPAISKHIKWTGTEDLNNWKNELIGTNAVINLAGASIAGAKWTDTYKKDILDSRINSTVSLVQAIKQTENPPALINASAIGYYGNRSDEVLDEESLPGNGFLADVVKQWEETAFMASSVTRVVTPRIGIVLSADGGALSKMITPFKFFVGGPLGIGNQFWSWIHIDDLAALFDFVLNNEIEGPVNFVSPNPVRMSEFAKALGKAMYRPSLLIVPEFMLKLILGESAEMVLGSQNVVPRKVLDKSFEYKFSELQFALKDLL